MWKWVHTLRGAKKYRIHVEAENPGFQSLTNNENCRELSCKSVAWIYSKYNEMKASSQRNILALPAFFV